MRQAPTHGYILYDSTWYRSTAHAYMKRLGLTTIKNKDGNTYTIQEIENSLIGFKQPTP